MQHSNAGIVIGGSFGAFDALDVILPAFPADFGVPIVIALHMLPTRNSGLCEMLASRTALRVKEAEDKEPVAGGTVYLASPNYHLLIERAGHFSLSADDLVNFSRPSIDVLFESAADACGPLLAGVLLSGANADGARGLARIRANGGVAVVQAPETALADAMPSAALRIDAGVHVFSPDRIGPFLVELERSDRFLHPNHKKAPA